MARKTRQKKARNQKRKDKTQSPRMTAQQKLAANAAQRKDEKPGELTPTVSDLGRNVATTQGDAPHIYAPIQIVKFPEGNPLPPDVLRMYNEADPRFGDRMGHVLDRIVEADIEEDRKDGEYFRLKDKKTDNRAMMLQLILTVGCLYLAMQGTVEMGLALLFYYMMYREVVKMKASARTRLGEFELSVDNTAPELPAPSTTDSSTDNTIDPPPDTPPRPR